MLILQQIVAFLVRWLDCSGKYSLIYAERRENKGDFFPLSHTYMYLLYLTIYNQNTIIINNNK